MQALRAKQNRPTAKRGATAETSTTAKAASPPGAPFEVPDRRLGDVARANGALLEQGVERQLVETAI